MHNFSHFLIECELSVRSIVARAVTKKRKVVAASFAEFDAWLQFVFSKLGSIDRGTKSIVSSPGAERIVDGVRDAG